MHDLSFHVLPAMFLGASHGHMNFVAIIVAGIAAFFVGGLWYSNLLFGKAWRRLSNVSADAMKSAKKGMVISFLSALIMAFGLAVILSFGNPDDLTDVLLIAAAVWFAFIATTMATSAAFNGRPFTLWLIDSGYQFASLLVIGAIVGSWH